MAKRTLKPGIYKILNISNGKFYVGSSTINIHQRWNDHKSQLKANVHSNIHLQRSFNKYGISNFEFIVLEYCVDVLLKEQYYIDTLKPHYNINPVASNSAGCIRTEKTCKLIGLSKLGNTNRLGQIKSNSEKLQISNTLKEGYKTGRIKHPMKGKNHNSKSIEKLKSSKLGNSIRSENPTYTDFYKLDKNTKVQLAYFKTARLCTQSLGITNRFSSSAIIKACRTGGSAFGFKWYSPNVQVKSDELLENP